MDTVGTMHLTNARQLFEFYRQLAEKAIEQVAPEQLWWQYNDEMNSIAIIVRHMAGNMLSRWTDFLHSDGEKSWRNRDGEFADTYATKEEMLAHWNNGWACLFEALDGLTEEHSLHMVSIRGELHTVVEAINRQIAHYAYHVGQIVFIAKMIRNEQWQSLSIPRNASQEYNQKKFGTSA